MPGFLFCKCELCDALIVAELIDASPPRCPGCGAKPDSLTEQGTILNGAAWRAGESKTKGRLLNVRVAYTPQRNRGGALARHERVIDRHGNRYFEKVTMCGSAHHAKPAGAGRRTSFGCGMGNVGLWRHGPFHTPQGATGRSQGFLSLRAACTPLGSR